MRKATLAAVLLLCAGMVLGASPDDRTCYLGSYGWQDGLYVSSAGRYITGTWSCTGVLCTEDTTSGQIVTLSELSVGDVVEIDGNTYEVESIVDDDNFTRDSTPENICGSGTITSDMSYTTKAVTSKTVYIVATGLHATREDAVTDGLGNASPLALSQDGVQVTSGLILGSDGLKVSSYQDGSSNEFLEIDDNTGTMSDGTGTGRLLLGGGSLTDPALQFGNSGIYGFRGGSNLIGEWTTVGQRMYADLAIGDFFTIEQANSNQEFTDTDGPQSILYVQGEIAQSSTAAYYGVFIDVTETSTGDASSGNGYNSPFRIDVGGTSIFQVDNTGIVHFPAREYCYTVPVTRATVGVTAPAAVLLGTYPALAFDADAETINVVVEIPEEWDAASDWTLKAYWYPESGDAVADTETVIFLVSLRATEEGEAYDHGSVYSTSATMTQSGAGTDKALYITSITLDYDNADQPFAAGDDLGILFSRDVTNDTYSGDAQVEKWELCGNVTAYPTHF